MAGLFDDLPDVKQSAATGGGTFGDISDPESALNQALRAAATVGVRGATTFIGGIADPLAPIRAMISPSLEQIESSPTYNAGGALLKATGIPEYQPTSPLGRIAQSAATGAVAGSLLGPWGAAATGFGGGAAQGVRELLAPSENTERLATAASFVPGLAVGAARGEYAPAAKRLKAAGDELYKKAQGFNIDVRPDAIADMANGIVGDLGKTYVLSEAAPVTYQILTEVAKDASAPVAPGTSKMVTIPQVEALRQRLNKVRADFNESASERAAAGTAIQGIDTFFDNLGPQHTLAGAPADVAAVADTYRQARGNWAAAQRSNDLTGGLDRANTSLLGRAEGRAEASNSGRNFDNLLRQKVASFLEQGKNVYGFSDAEIAALEGVRKGGPVQNISRRVGNLLGAGGGIGQAAIGLGGAGVGATYMGAHPGVAAASLAPVAIGMGAKALENALARRQMSQVDTMVRQRSPLYEGQAAGGANARDAMVLRALLPGLISGQQRPFGSL